TVTCVYCQAEDGIRDRNVTGVQTCALPICSWETQSRISGGGSNANAASNGKSHHQTGAAVDVSGLPGSYNKNQCSGYAPDGGCMTGGDLWTALHAAGLNHGMTVHDQEFWHFEFILSGDHRGRTNPFETL